MSIASQHGVGLGAGDAQGGLLDHRGIPVPKAVQFAEKDFQHFTAEVTVKGDDVVYHFWPPGDADRFVEGFAKDLESGFKATLPLNADVRAEFTSRDEAMVLMRHAEFPIQLDKQSRVGTGLTIARETYFVRVVGGAKYPLQETFLQERVFLNIEKAIRKEP